MIHIVFGQGEGVWDYSKARGSLEPQHWYLKYEHCNGSRQSPISIDCAHINPDSKLEHLHFINYDQPVSNLLLHNDGHTIKIDVPQDAGLRLRSGCLPASYRLSQFHFHWGTSKQGGSEHKLMNKRWPLEMHLVHVDEEIPVDQQTIDKNGMVVVSILFDYPRDADDDKDRLALDWLTHKISQTKEENQNVTLPPFIIGNLIHPHAHKHYLRYGGSLTTPPCAEVVEWFISTRTMVVTHEMLKRFRSTRQKIHARDQTADGDEVNIEENDRPLQPANDRPIRLWGTMGDLPSCDDQNNQ